MQRIFVKKESNNIPICTGAKEQADFITLSNEEDGVAHVIEQFLL